MNNNATPPEKPKRLKLDDLIGRRVELETDDGTLYARHLRIGDLEALAPLIDDPAVSDAALGREAVRRLLSRSKTAHDEPLTEEEVDSISSLDNLAGAAAQAIGTTLHPGGREPIEQIGSNVRQQARDLADTTRRVRQSYDSIGTALQSEMSKSLGAMQAAARNLTSMAVPAESLLRRAKQEITFESPPSKLHDMGVSPLVKSGEIAVQKLDNIATQLAVLASSESELLRTITLDVVPKWEAASRAADVASKLALRLSKVSVGIALFALLASAIVPYHIMQLQEAAAAADRKAENETRARAEALMRDQLDAMRALRSQLGQQAARAAATASTSGAADKHNRAFVGTEPGAKK